MNRIEYFFALLLLTAVLPLSLHAEIMLSDQNITTLIEDFEDENGEPAYDENFSHLFSSPQYPAIDTSQTYPEHNQMLNLGGGDYVTFNIPTNTQVDFASVEVCVWHNHTSESYHVTFIGEDSEKTFYPFRPSGVSPSPWHIFTITSEEIGNITAIDLFFLEGLVDNITIQTTVVPEPTSISCMLSIFLALLFIKQRKKL